jgi:virginiamycin B lyase
MTFISRFLGLCLLLLACSAALIASPAPAALTGTVSSDAEGPMEGVVVSAKLVGGAITVSVVSDKQGRYVFPADRLAAGAYELKTRAIGYDLANPHMLATITGKNAVETNIKLEKTRDLASQLSSAEWLMSIPGTREQKDRLFVVCMTCHTLAPIVKSRYDAEEWKTTLMRMWNWSQASAFNKPILSPNREGARPGDEQFAEYLSTINLSSKPKIDFDLKTLPRPKGDDTKVIVTEYDLPRPDAEPHDVAVDAHGIVWYCDYAEGLVGRLDPRTGLIKEWVNPTGKPGFPGGAQSMEIDSQGNPWLARHEFNGVSKFDVKSESFTNWSLPADLVSPRTRTTFVAPTRDGKVWIKDDVDHKAFLLDPATGKFTGYDQFPSDVNFAGQAAPRANFPGDVSMRDKAAPHHGIYGITADSEGNEYAADILGDGVAKIDVHTGKASLYTLPHDKSGPRRMHVDSQDHLWIGEYYGNRIAKFDPKAAQFQEWSHPIDWYGPYDVAPDTAGNVWTGSMATDLVTRLDPKTGKFTNYLLPLLGSNIRRVDVDNSGNTPICWIGENHRAKIAKIEPLD